jgi:hypothetical protein
MNSIQSEIAAAAAVCVVEEGLEYGPAKRRALKNLRLPPRTALPDNVAVEHAVREHIALFCADTQPGELRALRELALVWMERLADFEPLLGGAVWQGTATRLSDVYLQLFSDDPKAVEWWLINRQQPYEAAQAKGLQGHAVDVLSLQTRPEGLQNWVGLHLLVNPTQAQRGALLPDAQGRRPRGGAAALRNLLETTPSLS